MDLSEEIKVGDVVQHQEFNGGCWSEPSWKVLAISGSSVWLQYKDYTPRTSELRYIRKPLPKPKVVEVVRYGRVNTLLDKYSISDPFVLGLREVIGDTHKITFNLVDGVPDLKSIKMEKL